MHVLVSLGLSLEIQRRIYNILYLGTDPEDIGWLCSTARIPRGSIDQTNQLTFTTLSICVGVQEDKDEHFARVFDLVHFLCMISPSEPTSRTFPQHALWYV